MIRQAIIEDLPRLHECAKEFYASSEFLERFELGRFTSNWAQWIAAGLGAVFIAEEKGEVLGTIGGLMYPDPYSGDRIATEMFWIVRKEKRGPGLKLYRAFEAWARANHCDQIRMVHLLDSMPEKLERVYTHLGYKAAEVVYTKGLN